MEVSIPLIKDYRNKIILLGK